MFARSDRSRLERLLPPAVSSAAAQAMSGTAGAVGALYVLRSVGLPWLTVLVTTAVAQAVVAALVALTIGRGVLARTVGVLAAGLVRGLLLVFVIMAAAPGHLGTLSQMLVQVASSVVFTTVGFGAAGLIVQGARDFQTAFAARFDAAVAGLAISPDTESAVWSEARALAADEHRRARTHLDGVAVGDSGDPAVDDAVAGDLAAVAGAVHDSATERIRPASHALWRHARRPAPRLPLGVVIGRALRVWPASIPAAASASAVVVFIGALVSSGFVIALFSALVAAGVVVGCLALRARAQRSGRLGVAAVALLAVGPVSVVVLEAGGRALGFPANIGGVLVVGIAITSLTVTTVSAQGISRYRRALLDELDRLLASERWEAEVVAAVERRHAADAATFLHHRVQSQLLAAALQLELAARQDDPALVAAGVASARALLADPSSLPPVTPASRASVCAVRDEWAGICDIDLDLPAQGVLSAARWQVLDLLVREAVANAVRSGGATRMRVRVEPAPHGALDIEVWDDGRTGTAGARTGVSSAGLSSIGLGSAVLQALAGRHERRPAPGGGSVLTVRLPGVLDASGADTRT